MPNSEQVQCVIDAVNAVRAQLPEEYKKPVKKLVDRLNTEEFSQSQLKNMLREFRLVALDEISSKRISEQVITLNKTALSENVADQAEALVRFRNQLDPEARYNWFSGLFARSDVRKNAPDAQTGYKDGVLTNQVAGEQSLATGEFVNEVVSHEGKSLGQSVLNDREKSWSVVAEAVGVDTKDDLSKKLAGSFRAIASRYIERMQAAGVNVTNLPNYFPHKWDRVKLLSKDGGEAARKFFIEALDPIHHPDAGEIFDRMLAGIAEDSVLSSAQASLAMKRVLVFKDPDAELQALKLFSMMDPLSTMMSTLEDVARRTVLAEQFGPRPYEAMDELLEDATKRAVAAGMGEADARRTAKNSELLINYMRGDYSDPGSLNFAAGSRAARGMLSVMSLGKVGLYPAIIDPANAMGNLAGIKLPTEVEVDGKKFQFLRGSNKAMWMQQWLESAFKNNKQPDLLYNMSGASNLIANEHVINRFAQTSFAETGHGAEPGTVGRVINQVERGKLGSQSLMNMMGKLSGSMWLTQANQRAGAFVYQNALAQLARQGATFKDISKIQPELHRRMRESGITDDLWGRLSSEGHINKDGAMEMLSPELVDDFKDRGALAGFINREVRHMVAMPDVYSRAWVASKGKPGTAMGEAIQFAMQYHSIQLAFVRSSVTRGLSRGFGGTMAIATPMLLGGLAMTQMRQVVKGEPMYQLDSPVLYANALDYSGLGYLGGIAAREITTQYATGRTPSVAEVLGSAVGPGIGKIADTVDLGFKIGDDLIKRDRVGARTKVKANNLFWSSVPFNNLIYWHWALRRYVVDDINEDFDYRSVINRRKYQRKIGLQDR